MSASGWSSTLTHSLSVEASCRRTTRPQKIHWNPDSTKRCTVDYCQLTFTKKIEIKLLHTTRETFLSRVTPTSHKQKASHEDACASTMQQDFKSSAAAAASASIMGCKLEKHIGGHNPDCHLRCGITAKHKGRKMQGAGDRQQKMAELRPGKLL